MSNVKLSVLRQLLMAVVTLAATLLVVSCSTHYNNNAEDLTPVNIQVSFEGFDLSTSPMTRAGEQTTTTIPDGINRLALKVFNGEGTAVSTITQKKEETGFGTVSLTLIPGEYTFVCILNEATGFGSTPLADVAPATITSATLATIPGTVAHETYCCVQTLMITSSTTSLSFNMGSRINARFSLTINDDAPSNVKTLAVIINPVAPRTEGGCLSINPTTGRATSEILFMGTKSVSGHITDTFLDIYVPETNGATFTTSVRLEGRDDATPDPNILYTRTIANVPFASNQNTHAQGSLFTPSDFSITFSFSNPWDGVNEITF